MKLHYECVSIVTTHISKGINKDGWQTSTSSQECKIQEWSQNILNESAATFVSPVCAV